MKTYQTTMGTVDSTNVRGSKDRVNERRVNVE